MGIRVKVKEDNKLESNFTCFHGLPRSAGRRYRPGESFDIHSVEAFSDAYMECVEDGYTVEGGRLVEKQKGPGRPSKQVESE